MGDWVSRLGIPNSAADDMPGMLLELLKVPA
jgi:hypothetical protein